MRPQPHDRRGSPRARDASTAAKTMIKIKWAKFEKHILRLRTRQPQRLNRCVTLWQLTMSSPLLFAAMTFLLIAAAINAFLQRKGGLHNLAYDKGYVPLSTVKPQICIGTEREAIKSKQNGSSIKQRGQINKQCWSRNTQNCCFSTLRHKNCRTGITLVLDCT